MRKIIVSLIAAGLVAAALAVPAQAGKPKKVHGTFGGTLAPFPKDTRWEVLGPMNPGCTAGQEGVHWVSQEFTAPGKGVLRFYMEGFDGDHDIYIFSADGEMTILARGDTAQVPDLAPPEEEILFPTTKGMKILLAACNWAGEPSVEAHFEGTFK